MHTTTNSETFERAARREISAGDAARALLAGDAERRKQRVTAARPLWVPAIVWAVATAIIVSGIDALHRRS